MEGTSFTTEECKMLKKIMDDTDTKTIKDCLSDMNEGCEPKLLAQVSTDNAKLNFDFVDVDTHTKKHNPFHTPSKTDYCIPRDEDAVRKGFQEDMPISFLSIQNGEVEKGKCWYLARFPKLPEEIAELLARYNWGDLKYMTKKKVKNDKKKAVRKGKKYEPLSSSSLVAKKGNFVVSFA